MVDDEALTKLYESLDLARQAFYRLVLLVGPIGSGKTALLRELAKRYACPKLNVNLELSQRLLDLPRSRRARQVDRMFRELIVSSNGDPVLLDNLEILFDPSLHLDPVRLLHSVSRNQTVVASWNGILRDGMLTYAEPDHPEYRSYRDADAVFVLAGQEHAASH